VPSLKFIPLVCLFCAPLFALSVDKQISQYAHTAWRIQDGIFSGSPLPITQTTDGYIWVGTQSGILRFDGVRFVPWTPPGGEALRSAQIYALRGTADGSLWIGTLSDGLWHWANGRLTGYMLSIRSRVTGIVEDGRESVWITRSGDPDDVGNICEAGWGKFRCYGESNGIPHECCTDLAREEKGNLWIGSATALIKWKPRSTETYISKILGAVANQTATYLAPLQDGSTWVGVDVPGRGRGLQHFKNGSWTPVLTADWDSSKVGVRALLLDSRNSLWIGTNDHGLYRIRDGKRDHFGSAEGLSSDFVNRIFEDHEGNLWVSTNNGLDCFRDLAVTTFTAHEGLGAVEVDTVLASRDGTIWAGGDRALDSIHDGRISSLRSGKNLPGVQVTSLFEDHAGRLWVGLDRTISIMKNGGFSEVKRPDGRALGFVVGIAEDTENNVWAEVSTNPRELIRIRDLQVKEVFPAPEMPLARKVAADPNGGIWLGLMNGDISRYRRGKLETFHFQHKKESFVNEISVSPDGSVLGATSFGLIGWRQGKQQILTVLNGLPCDGVNAHVWDDRGSLWLYTQCGLIQIAGSELQKWWGNAAAVLKTRVFDANDGVQAGLAPFQKAARSTDGKLWFVNQSNLQMIDPVHLPVNAIPPPVQVEEVIANGQTFSPANDLRFAALTRDVAIRYTALSFVAPQKVRFRYMLEGQDKTWQEAGTRREAFYTNLAPASYRFRVMACNNDGLWNEAGATWNFQIEPAFYQTGWFRLLCIFTAITICISFYLFRLKQATAQIQARLGERLMERERIARELHDTLLQGFNGLVLRFEAVRKKMTSEDPAREMMGKVLERADEVLLEGRLRVRDLRSELPPPGDLAKSLAECGEELSKHSTISFSLTIQGSSQALGPKVLDEAYRIGREALQNAISHSGASKIETEISFEPSLLRLRVRDDGSGIDQKTLNDGRPGHWGLSGMRERAQTVSATLNIWSNPGVGTEIDLTIPAKVAYLKKPGTIRWRWVQEAVHGGRQRK
jgi:signal transduction histidine kinase/ligand-binding sensor domain-containing protein